MEEVNIDSAWACLGALASYRWRNNWMGQSPFRSRMSETERQVNRNEASSKHFRRWLRFCGLCTSGSWKEEPFCLSPVLQVPTLGCYKSQIWVAGNKQSKTPHIWEVCTRERKNGHNKDHTLLVKWNHRWWLQLKISRCCTKNILWS